MVISETIRGYGAVADPATALQLKKLCSTNGVELESFPDPELILAQLEARAADFLIADPCSFRPGGGSLAGGLTAFIRKARQCCPGVPILILVEQSPDEELKSRALEAGASDFLAMPLSVPEFTMRIQSLSRILLSRRQSRSSSQLHEEEMRTVIAELMLREYETLYVLGKAAEYKDRETGHHIARVAHYSRLVARMIGESQTSQDALFHASALHDIGKLGIPDAILLKPGKLTDPEFEVMKTHAMIGHGILRNSRSSYLLTGAMIALTHHERFDGTGYPMNLQADEIPLYGRIVCLADVFDALTTRRPYKEPWPIQKAFELLAKERGKQFDPVLVDAFLSNARGVEDIYYNHADIEAAAGYF